MKESKRKKLESKGWKLGDAAEFLELSDKEQNRLVFNRLRETLGAFVRELRTENEVTQVELAKAVRSSQSRIAKIEAADKSVTIDSQIKSLLALGASVDTICVRIHSTGELVIGTPKETVVKAKGSRKSTVRKIKRPGAPRVRMSRDTSKKAAKPRSNAK